ncbi:hypothetical protein DL93DRAFT_1114723 [Clavulina sp. PMI_390]|nr:hypothetical protein DL93DRAFT_1114723 [Clavulina sp. PMI_390]
MMSWQGPRLRLDSHGQSPPLKSLCRQDYLSSLKRASGFSRVPQLLTRPASPPLKMISLPLVLFAVLLPQLAGAKNINPLPLGAACSSDSECGSTKCWPEWWYYGPTVCSPSATGHSCRADTSCITGHCDNDVCAQSTTTYQDKCYSAADCLTGVCMSPWVGGAQYTQCYPSKTGMTCNMARPDYCISGICTDDGSGNGTGLCAPSAQYGNCYSMADCQTGMWCEPRSSSNVVGGCTY